MEEQEDLKRSHQQQLQVELGLGRMERKGHRYVENYQVPRGGGLPDLTTLIFKMKFD